MQGPSPLLSEATISSGVDVFFHSLQNLQSRFPKSEIFVVYLPSVMTSYRHVENMGLAHIQVRGRPKRAVSISFMEKRSDHICKLINAATSRVGATFIDVRSAVRKATRREILHGPRDGSHFNKLGYEVLATAVVNGVRQEKRNKVCKDISSN